MPRKSRSTGKRPHPDFGAREESGNMQLPFGSDGDPEAVPSGETGQGASDASGAQVPEATRGFYPGLQEARRSIKDFERTSANTEGRAPRDFGKGPGSSSICYHYVCKDHESSGCEWKFTVKKTRKKEYADTPYYVADCKPTHTCFGTHQARIEYWEIQDSPAFKEDQNHSKSERCGNEKLAAKISEEGRIHPTAAQVAEAKRTVGVHAVSDWCRNFLYIVGWLALYASREDNRLQRLFFMPGAAKYLLPRVCLKTLAVDGCHMKHRLFQFVLILLVARDGNLAGLPIAMA
eukprot:CAMPEP_0181293958 /NCGR_PEP_ID=MMETSP1101-20121128/3341_1 /TAXON_ID=46948 /ORGANISM="Rhodomonas abbreviata, Strain Caron Lab Isolate" /LENGTH=290 /DNA_ID=CAMNT_0023398577 /DNA_START=8 /DNA_END=876 /DNA_ORIENTATION=+